MMDPVTTRRWMYRLLLLGLALALIFLHLLPLGSGPALLPTPDLTVALIFAWVLRRPEFAPALLIAGIILLGDFLFMRPPGLWAAFVVGGAEFLRSREHAAREMPFPVEWALVGTVMVVMALGYRLVLTVFIVDQVSLGLTLLQLILTIASYPLVAFVGSALFGIRKITPSEANELRQRA